MTKAFLISLFAIVLCFGIMDAVWLGMIASDTYQQEMQGMLRDEYPVWPWVSFYIIYALSINVLAVQPSYCAMINSPSLNRNALAMVAFRGFLLGLAAYGAYNLTNYAILASWSLKISIIDWAWGCFITTSSACAGALGVTKFKTMA